MVLKIAHAHMPQVSKILDGLKIKNAGLISGFFFFHNAKERDSGLRKMFSE